METKIENYIFVLNEDNTISVNYKINTNTVAIIKPDKQLTEKKDFDIECMYWWRDNGV